MQTDHRANLDAEARVVGESLAVAWAHFHLLRGLDNGRIKHPDVTARSHLLYDRMWRAAFDSFFAKVGVLLDSKRGNHSLLSFLTLARRYGDPEVTRLLPAIEVHLSDESTALAKLKRWRHEVVAHKPAGRDLAGFHVAAKMTLTEIELALNQLDDYFNQISWNMLNLHSEHRSAFEGIVLEAESLFAAASRGGAPENE
jgi:hypothetical protein